MSEPGPEANYRELLQVVRGPQWVFLCSFVGLTLWWIAYMILGYVPMTVSGNTIFLKPESVVIFQSNASGQIIRWQVRVGDRVTKGQLLATLEQPVISKELEQARLKLADEENRNKTILSYLKIFIDMEKDTVKSKRATLQARIEILEAQNRKSKEVMEATYANKTRYQDQNEKDLNNMHNLYAKRTEEYEEKLGRQQELRKQNLRTEDDIVTTWQDVVSGKNRLASSELQIAQLAAQRPKAFEEYLKARDRIADEENQINDLAQAKEELNDKEAELDEEWLTFYYTAKLKEDELRRSIERSEKQLRDNRQVLSEYTGRVLELSASVGQVVSKGSQLGTMQLDSDKPVEAISYFKLADGKKIKPGMRLRITPATVQRERSGSIIAKVRSVSSFPVTTEAVNKRVGNMAAANFLTKDERHIEVYAELGADSNGDYKWDSVFKSKTPVTSGTIGTALVDVRQKPLLAFVFPGLDK